MSDVMKKILDHELHKQEDQTVVELVEKELKEVNGAWFDGFFPAAFNNSTSLAVTSLAFTNNNSGIW
jgi:hypothetical protein